MKEYPLVSIVVLTYNSSEYILETLDSIKTQDYPNIELVVSDDGSKDDTFLTVNNWINQYGCKFKRAVSITANKNRGTCCNYNNGVINSSGKYIKTLDGDDCLNGSDSISRYVEFMLNHDCEICISDVNLFTKDDMDITEQREWYNHIFRCMSETYEEQRARISKELRIADPGMFFSRKLFDEVGGFDEQYKLMEEWPFYYNVIMKGHQVFSIPEKLVSYRLVKKSISHNTKSIAFIWLLQDQYRFFFRTRFRQLIKDRAWRPLFAQSYKYIKMAIRYCFI